MHPDQLHRDAVIFDGLIVSNWSRPVFEAMHAGGLTAANCTCSVWENFTQSMANIAQWKRWFAEHDDLIMHVTSTADIERAKAVNRVGICLGSQNTSGIEDRHDHLELFKSLGVGVMQMTYNTQNYSGCGCYESHDGGLSDFGKEVLAEMNRLGIVCDLSHVGAKTSDDVIRRSKQPVCYSHCLPSALKEHPRNKSDDQLRVIAGHGGFVGVTMFSPFLRRGPDSTLEDYLAAIEHVIAIVGEDQVGIGTDFTQGYGNPFFDWISHDKGSARRLVEFGTIANPLGLRELKDYPNLTAAMLAARWPEQRVRKILGLNWLRFLRDVWRS
jgi:membrane dipeptidase